MGDSSVTAAIAAGRVPSDISLDLLYESRDGPSRVALIFVLCLTTVVVSLRCVSRGWLVKRLGLDDFLAILSLACMAAFVGLCVVLIDIGSGRHYLYIMYVMDEDTVKRSEVLDFAAHIVYTSALMICRLSGLAFYYQLCGFHERFGLAVKVVAGFIVAAYLPQLFLIIFHCLPVTGLWPYEWEPEVNDYSCLQWGVVYSVNSSISLVSDALIFGIPIFMISLLEISRKRRVQLACIFLPGIFVVAISITRLVLVVQGQWETDESWFYNPMLAVEASEIGSTLIALSVPGCKPLFDKLFLRRHLGSTLAPDSNGDSLARRPRNAPRNIKQARHDSLQDDGHFGSRPSVLNEYALESNIRDSHSVGSTEEILVRVYSEITKDDPGFHGPK